LRIKEGGEQLTVEIAVSNVSDHACEKAGLADVVFRFLDDVWQAAHGHGLH
jgi:hypothetical protein